MSELPPSTARGLGDLVRAQSLSIAFENLDVLAGRPVQLEPEAIFDKILLRGRGGYCFELNGLLACALESAGFQCRSALARVTFGRDTPGPASHQVIIVGCEGGEWLVDVGFGGPGLIEPIPFVAGRTFVQGRTSFRLETHAEGGVQLERLVAGTWRELYLVPPSEATRADIEAANHFVSTFERSPFRFRLMCALALHDGLLTTQGTELVHLDHDLTPTNRVSLEDPRGLKRVLRTMGVHADYTLVHAAWERVAQKMNGAAA